MIFKQNRLIQYLLIFIVISLVGCGGGNDSNKPVYIYDFYVETPYQTDIEYYGAIINNTLKTVTIGYSISNNISGSNSPRFGSYGTILSPWETLEDRFFAEGSHPGYRAGTYEATLTLFDISDGEETQIDEKTITFTIPNTAEEPISIQNFTLENITSSSIVLEGVLRNDSLGSHSIEWEFFIYLNGNLISGMGSGRIILGQETKVVTFNSTHIPTVSSGNYEAVLNLMASDPDRTIMDTKTINFTVQ